MIWCDVVVRMYGKWIWDYFTLWVRFENFLKIARCNLKMLLSIKSSLTFRVITHLSYDPHSPAHLKHTLERKKFLYEGCTRQGDRSGKKTHAAVLEVHTTPQKQCETIFLLQSVFWKEWSYDKIEIVGIYCILLHVRNRNYFTGFCFCDGFQHFFLTSPLSLLYLLFSLFLIMFNWEVTTFELL